MEVIEQLNDLYKDFGYKIWTKEDLSNEIYTYCEKYQHGYGYFIWKPYLIKKDLHSIKEGDILFYIDGRSGLTKKILYKLRNKVYKIPWLTRFIQSDEFELGIWRMDHNPERVWTTGDLFDLFNTKLEDEEAKSGQYSATFFCIRKTKDTVELVNQWFQYMNENLNLTRDEESTLDNHLEFKQNRYDQSFLSLLIKKQFSHISKLIITNKDIFDKETLIPHMKEHPK